MIILSIFLWVLCEWVRAATETAWMAPPYVKGLFFIEIGLRPGAADLGILGKFASSKKSKNKKIKNRKFYKKCNLVINHHLLRRINSSLPQWKSWQKTVQDTMVKSPKIEIFENFENPHPGKSKISSKFQCFLMKWSFVQQIRCKKPIFDTDFSSRIDW